LSIGEFSSICKISVKTFSFENKNFWNDFKELNSKLLRNNENGKEERNSNSNKLRIEKLR
jgi:hypothetical protein